MFTERTSVGLDVHARSVTAAAIDASVGTYSYVKTDFDPHARSGRLDVGADEHGGPVSRKALTKADVGPSAP